MLICYIKLLKAYKPKDWSALKALIMAAWPAGISLDRVPEEVIPI